MDDQTPKPDAPAPAAQPPAEDPKQTPAAPAQPTVSIGSANHAPEPQVGGKPEDTPQDNPLSVTHGTVGHRTSKKSKVLLIIILALLIAAGAVYYYASKKKPVVNTTSTTPNTTTTTSATDVDEALESVDSTIKTSDDTKDLNTNDLTSSALGL